MASASGTRLAPSSRRRAMIGVNGPLLLFSLSASACACSLARSPSLQGSASTTPAGSTEATAVAASGQPASTIGKAPAARKASTTSGAGLSATTRNGPCSAMAGCGIRGCVLEPCQSAVNGPLLHPSVHKRSGSVTAIAFRDICSNPVNGPGCVKTKSDLVVMPSGGRIFVFFRSAHDHRAQNSRCGYTASSFHTA